VPKQFLRIGRRTILEHAISRLAAHPRVDALVVVVPPANVASLGSLARRHPKVRAVVAGGARRQDSVARGLEAIPSSSEAIVLVHDAARPLVPRKVISDVIRGARIEGAAVPGIPPTDTVKEVGASGRVRRTVPRGSLRMIQTPQAFRIEWLRQAMRGPAVRRERTDDASLVEAVGRPVLVVEGSPLNFKVTTPDDVERARSLLRTGGRKA
jgi:2-C-methyl-D-erythritol 4-phosphate cytidylyltransferase